jgi:hypothetical protein
MHYTYTITAADGEKEVGYYEFSVVDEKNTDGQKIYQIRFNRSHGDAATNIECIALKC